MSSHQNHDGPESRLHARLGELVTDAVSDVEPGDRLDAIRARTAVSTLGSRRPWLYGVAGAVVATAATITAVAVLGNQTAPSSEGPAPAVSPSIQGEDSNAPEPTTSPEPEPTASDRTQGGDGSEADAGGALPVYYVGDGPRGPVLFREFHNIDIASPQGRLQGSLIEAVAAKPLDPDYRSAWPSGTSIDTVEDADITADLITVRLVSDGTPLRARPAGLSAVEAELSVQQLVYTAQAAVGEGRIPVQILLDGERTDTVLGVPTAEPLANADPIEVLSLMNISTPTEGAQVDDVFSASGVSSGFEANVQWQVIDPDDLEVLVEGYGTAEGWMDKLYPWEVEVDVSELAPGSYIFLAANSDPSGGAEGNGPAADTRTIVVE